MHWRLGDDPGSGAYHEQWGGEGVAGDRPDRYAERIYLSGAARPGAAQAGSAWRPPLRFPGPSRRSFEDYLARWPRRMPVLQAARARALHLADRVRRCGCDLTRTTRLHARRDRLARTAIHLASGTRGLTLAESVGARGVWRRRLVLGLSSRLPQVYHHITD